MSTQENPVRAAERVSASSENRRECVGTMHEAVKAMQRDPALPATMSGALELIGDTLRYLRVLTCVDIAVELTDEANARILAARNAIHGFSPASIAPTQLGIVQILELGGHAYEGRSEKAKDELVEATVQAIRAALPHRAVPDFDMTRAALEAAGRRVGRPIKGVTLDGKYDVYNALLRTLGLAAGSGESLKKMTDKLRSSATVKASPGQRSEIP